MTLHEKALQIRAAQEEQRLKREQEHLAQIKERLEDVERGFCTCFAHHLPLLQRHGIKWSAHLNDTHNIYDGSYIEFEMDGKCLKMDFKGSHEYQYKYTGHSQLNTPDAFSKTKDGFILFLDEFFFSEKPELVAEHKEESTLWGGTPPTDIESALWGELFDYEDWDGNKGTIYRVWRRVHHVLCLYANSDEAAFLKMIKSFKEEKPEPVAEHKEEVVRQVLPDEEMETAIAKTHHWVDVWCPFCPAVEPIEIKNEELEELNLAMGNNCFRAKGISVEIECPRCENTFIVTDVEY